jgi:hypothetical protein
LLHIRPHCFLAKYDYAPKTTGIVGEKIVATISGTILLIDQSQAAIGD